MPDTVKINRGIKGIYFERSAVSLIDGAKGELSYRGYSIHDLAAHSSFEEAAYLLIYGDLPNVAQLADFDARLKAARVTVGTEANLHGAIVTALSTLAGPAHGGGRPRTS